MYAIPSDTALPVALATLAEVELQMGDWPAAHAAAVESLRLSGASGRRDAVIRSLSGLAVVEAHMGREADCRRHAEQAIALGARAGDYVTAGARAALGLLELGLGDSDAAIRWLEPIRCDHATLASTVCCDLVEARIRSGDHRGAAELLDALEAADCCSRLVELRLALARCRGLLAPDEEYELHFTRALAAAPFLVERFGRARSRLCYGQRLRRTGRRVAARKQLRLALEAFEQLGAEPWAEMTRTELQASGATARKRVDSTRDDLTPQELQVALIVAGGATNRETANRLFVTEKTVETHLSSVYRKLGLRSRTELARRMTLDRAAAA
jgi:DNA-binding CsgD family transcriptional regulator